MMRKSPLTRRVFVLACLSFLAIAAFSAAMATATAPTVTADDAAAVEYTTAEVSGTIDRQGQSTAYRFQYATQADFSDAVTGAEGTLNSGGPGPQKVEGRLTGLQPSTTYHLRLVAENADGQSAATAAATFTTKAATTPKVDETSFGQVTYTEATFRALINPRGAETAYRFQYVDQQTYEESGFEEALATPSTPLAGAADPDDTATAQVSGLQPATTYRLRVVAENAKGPPVAGSQVTFRTYALPPQGPDPCPNAQIRSEQHSAYLPDCRAYEQVSPQDKLGGDVIAYGPRTRASEDGEAASFASLQAFADAQGTGVATEYLARRGPSGWAAHAITPALGSNTLSNLAGGSADSYYEGELSPDLSAGVFSSGVPLPGTPASVAEVSNLYLRSDLLDPGAGSYQLITACPLCEASSTPLAPISSTAVAQVFHPYLAGASPDMAHVAFTSTENLTADAPAQLPLCGTAHTVFPAPSPIFCRHRLYEWDRATGTVRLAGILPDGSAADVSFAGANGDYAGNLSHTPHVVSDGSDGHSRLFFTQSTDAAGNTASELDESDEAVQGQFANQSPTYSGNLFMRVDNGTPGAHTEQLNESERSEPPGPDAFAAAQYLDASADGERSFFVTRQALTDDAATTSEHRVNLYMYDAEAPAGERLTLLNGGLGNAAGLLGTSADGHYAYMAIGAGGSVRLYLWHDGAVKAIGTIPTRLSTNVNLTGPPQTNNVALRQADVSPDGRHLVFASTRGAGLTGYDSSHGPCAAGAAGFNGGCFEIYAYDAETEKLQCASCNPSGAPASAEAMVAAYETNAGGARVTSHETRGIGADGRYVFFSSKEALVPTDTDGVSDAYEYDTQTEEAHLLSSGTDPHPSWFLETGESGRDVFIATRQALSGTDTDSAYDLYDVRIGGGFPEPAARPAPCTSPDTCRGAGAPAPEPAPLGSTATGQGNPKAPPCPKGKRAVKRHGKTRCLKAKHRRHRGHHRGSRR